MISYAFARRGRARPAVLAWGIATLVFAIAGCVGWAGGGGPVGAEALTARAAQVVRSDVGVVASASVLATEVGAGILAAGGNAVDAAVATGFALAVTEPSMSGLGGRASTLIRLPDGAIVGFDGLNQVPHGYAPESGLPPGYERAAIPGVPAALVRVHEAHGTLPLARVMEGAIRLAEEGFALPADEAARWAGGVGDLAEYPASRELWLRPDGSPREAGERFRNPDLARALRAIAADGWAGFYSGWVADSIHAEMTRLGGFITREELAGYDALSAIPARGSYRGYEIASNFRPAAGHAVVEALQILEEVGVPEADEGARWAAVVSQAMQLAISDRNGNHGSEEESAAVLTSREHARTRAEEITVPTAVGVGVGSGVGWGRGVGQFGEVGAEIAREWSFDVPPGTLVTSPSDREATTHLVTADASGMVVTHTQSNGPAMGTRLTASGLGFFYATRLGSTPGSRPSSTIAPTLVLHPDGRPWFALGGAGDARIISAVIQVVSRRIDHEMTLPEAVAAPRVHPNGLTGVSVESGPVGRWEAADLALLREQGFEVEGQPSGFFGRVHAVEFEAGGLLGVAEPRWTGSAVGVRRE
ncbi:MAG: gamma-glutamyltransferase [Gemmatimonadota bacterium]